MYHTLINLTLVRKINHMKKQTLRRTRDVIVLDTSLFHKAGNLLKIVAGRFFLF